MTGKFKETQPIRVRRGDRWVGGRFQPPARWRSPFPTPTQIRRGKVNYDNLKRFVDIMRAGLRGDSAEAYRLVQVAKEANRKPRQLEFPLEISTKR